MQSGTVYTWGKGEHEKPKFNDYQEYSSPFVIMEEKKVEHLAFGRSHVMALERGGQVHCWGDGKFGCLGLSDNKRRATPVQLSYFEGQKVIDVSCGDQFTVFIVEVPEEFNFGDDQLIKKEPITTVYQVKKKPKTPVVDPNLQRNQRRNRHTEESTQEMEEVEPIEEFIDVTKITYIPESELRHSKEPLKSARVPLSSGIDISRQIRDKVKSVIVKNNFR